MPNWIGPFILYMIGGVVVLVGDRSQSSFLGLGIIVWGSAMRITMAIEGRTDKLL